MLKLRGEVRSQRTVLKEQQETIMQLRRQVCDMKILLEMKDQQLLDKDKMLQEFEKSLESLSKPL